MLPTFRCKWVQFTYPPFYGSLPQPALWLLLYHFWEVSDDSSKIRSVILVGILYLSQKRTSFSKTVRRYLYSKCWRKENPIVFKSELFREGDNDAAVRSGHNPRSLISKEKVEAVNEDEINISTWRVKSVLCLVCNLAINLVVCVAMKVTRLYYVRTCSQIPHGITLNTSFSLKYSSFEEHNKKEKIARDWGKKFLQFTLSYYESNTCEWKRLLCGNGVLRKIALNFAIHSAILLFGNILFGIRISYCTVVFLSIIMLSISTLQRPLWNFYTRE